MHQNHQVFLPRKILLFLFLDVKNPKLYKKVKRYYEGLQYIDLSGEDPDADYNAVIDCIIEDLQGVI